MQHVTETIPLPTTSPGTKRFLIVHRWGKPHAGEKIYIQAAIHADEWPGVMAIQHLIPMLDVAAAENRINGEIVIVPFANPIGMSQWVNDHLLGRYRLSDGGGNFNRDWPDLSGKVLDLVKNKLVTDSHKNKNIMRRALRQAVSELPDSTEKEAHQKILLSLSIDADYVLDLHCDWRATLHLYAHIEHKHIVMELARDMRAPVVLLEDGVDGGPFDECNAVSWIKVRRALDISTEALPASCFSVTIEHRGHGDISDELGAQDAENLMNFLNRRGVITGKPPILPNALCEATPLDACDMIYAPIAGIIVWKKKLGEQVQLNEHIADIIDLAHPDTKKARTPVHAKQIGILFSQHVDHLTRPGEVIGKIAGKKSLAHRQGVPLLSNR